MALAELRQTILHKNAHAIRSIKKKGSEVTGSVHLSRLVCWMELGAVLALAWALAPMPATSSNLLDFDWMWLSCQSADPVAGDHPGPHASQGQSADARGARWHFVRDAPARLGHIEHHNRPRIAIPDLPSPVEHGHPPPAQACARRLRSGKASVHALK